MEGVKGCGSGRWGLWTIILRTGGGVGGRAGGRIGI